MNALRPALLAVFLLPVVAAGDIYRHVDDNGNVSYSDEPRNGGEPVDVEDSGSSVDFRTPDRPEPVSRQNDTQADDETAYPDLRIVKPEDEGTVRSNQGLVEVRAATQNQLPRAYRFQFLLDGSSEGEPTPTPRFQFTGVNRGEHTVQVRIVDASGASVAESDTVTFYMHQSSRLIGGDGGGSDS